MEKFLTSASTSKKHKLVDNDKKLVNEERKRKYRKYDESYLNFGFTVTTVNNEERPQCVLCLKILSVESMLPSKLKRHLESFHKSHMGKSREYFSRKENQMNEQKSIFSKQATISSKALLASYKVAYRIAKCKKPHTIAQELILPCAIDMVSIMVGESVGKQLLPIPLSDNTISRRIQDLGEDLNQQIVQKIKGKDFGLQFDEATDSNRDSHLICYVRFVDDLNEMVEDLLFCKDIVAGTTGKDLFQIVDNFMMVHEIDWTNCVGVCTDGARAMSGCYSGLKALILAKAPDSVWTHCIIHREALASQSMSADLNEVLQTVINVVNYIKTRPQKARFFSKMCQDMGAEHTALLFYTSARWLSRGYALSRVFELRQELYSYLDEENHASAKYFLDTDFMLKVAYLCDIFEKLNLLNKSLQGNETHRIQLIDKVSAFKKKLCLWKSKLDERGEMDYFPVLQQFITDHGLDFTEDIASVIQRHLAQLSIHFEKYFPEENNDTFQWIQNPFSCNTPPDFSTVEEEELIELSSDSSLKVQFISLPLPKFWNLVKREFPRLNKRAMKILIPFATSYLCEAGFSAVAIIKTKYRSKLDLEKEMRVAVSHLVPRFDKLCEKKQPQVSH